MYRNARFQNLNIMWVESPEIFDFMLNLGDNLINKLDVLTNLELI